MFQPIIIILAVSLTLVSCGTLVKDSISLSPNYEEEKQQSAGNASLAASLHKAKPLVDLNKTD